MLGGLAAVGIGVWGLAWILWGVWEWGVRVGVRRAVAAEEDGVRQGGEPRDFSVTVLVCVRNGAADLPDLLAGLEAQVPGADEVLVVDDGSVDATPAVLRSWQERWGRDARGESRLSIVRLEDTRPGKKEAFAAGVAAARGEVIVATDVDCVPAEPEWLEAMAAGLGGAQARWDVRIGVSLPTRGPVEPGEPGRAAWMRWLLTQWSIADALRIARTYVAAAGWGRPYMAVGRNLAFRKKVFPGWDGHADLASGDDDLLVQTWHNQKVVRWAVATRPASQMPTRPPRGLAHGTGAKLRHLTTGPRYPLHVVLALALPALAVLAMGGGAAVALWYLPAGFMHIGVWIVGLTLLAMGAVQVANFRTFAARCGLTGRLRYVGVWVPWTWIGLSVLTSASALGLLLGIRRRRW